jgi:hypothetical protein
VKTVIATIGLFILLGLIASSLIAADQTAVDYITERYADAPEPGAKARYSPRIQALWIACDLKEQASGNPCMDFDIWVNAQDWEIKDLKIEQLKADDNSAHVLASFSNTNRKETIGFDLLRDSQGWLVDTALLDRLMRVYGVRSHATSNANHASES